ncbi:MAG: methyltransferase domain-containing protein [Acidimicrobiales bacterium]
MNDEPADGAKSLVRKQFGANAANYATSKVHAKGASLGRLVELVSPQPDWRVLDVATAAGHTAFVMAPHVEHVTATDLTSEMLEVAARLAIEKQITNVDFETADAESLPYDDSEFDLVTCRIAPHHFPHPDRFVNEALRVLVSGGRFAMVDNIVPDDLAVAEFANSWERRRDPSHVRCLSISEWTALLEQAGFVGITAETALKRMDFDTWADNMNVPADVRIELRHDLVNASEVVREFLRPEPGAFYLTEGLFTTQKP